MLMIKFPRNADDKYFPEIANGLGTSIQHHEMVAIFHHFWGAERHWTNCCCQRVV